MALAPPGLGIASENIFFSVISRQTVDAHREVHRMHVEKSTALATDSPWAKMPLQAIIRNTAGKKEYFALFGHAAQAWSHDFYWKSLHPQGKVPTAAFLRLIERDIGSFSALKSALVEEGVSHFGSGWLWLVEKNGRLHIYASDDAGHPLANDQTPLLAVDLWEHAYCLDHGHDRAAHLFGVVQKLLNWRFAEKNWQRQI